MTTSPAWVVEVEDWLLGGHPWTPEGLHWCRVGPVYSSEAEAARAATMVRDGVRVRVRSADAYDR